MTCPNCSKFVVFATALLAVPISHAAVYSEGHADLGVAYEDGVLDFHFHGEGAVIDGIEVDDREYTPGEIVILGASTSMAILPEGFDIPALGKSVGDPVWVLPWTQEDGLPFLGTASEELNPADWIGGITFTLGTVVSPSGSGEFALWRYGSFGNMMVDLSTVTGQNSVTTITGSHDHFNWGFTEPGEWKIELTASGTHVTDGFVSDTETFTFVIVPEPATSLLTALAVIGFTLRRRR